MSTIESVKTQIQTLIEQANTKTGVTSTNLTSAVNTLCEGYGQGGTSDIVAWVTFMSEDGSIEYGKRAVIKGDDCPNPIDEDLFATPTKEQTETNTFTFSGWSTTIGGSVESSALKDITEDINVYATFASAVRYYSVKFYDGETLLKTESVAYGGSSTYKYNKTDYVFQGWTPQPTNVTSDMNCYGEWLPSYDFSTLSWDRIIEIADSGDAPKYFNVGATKNITFNGKTLTLQIAGFNHDDLADGSGKAHITLTTKTAPQTTSETPNFYFDEANLKNWSSNIQTINSTYFSYLPTALRNAIKQVKKPCDASVTYGESIIQNITCQLFPLSVTEINAHQLITTTAWRNDTNIVSVLGTPYALYDGTSTLLKGTNSLQTYSPLRTNYRKSDGTFGYLSVNSSNGTIATLGSSTSPKARHTIFGFCI